MLFFLPFIVIFLPEVFIIQPNFFKNLIRSSISGSIAQLDKTVFPSAPKAASKAFSVAPTETVGNFTLVPIKPFIASVIIYPSLIYILAPNFFNAKRFRSAGLDPIAHPPGNETLAFLYLVKRGPSTKTPALIVLTNL